MVFVVLRQYRTLNVQYHIWCTEQGSIGYLVQAVFFVFFFFFFFFLLLLLLLLLLYMQYNIFNILWIVYRDIFVQ